MVTAILLPPYWSSDYNCCDYELGLGTSFIDTTFGRGFFKVRMMSNYPIREIVWAGAIFLVGCMLPKIAAGQDCNNNGVPDAQDVDPTDPDGDGEVFSDCDWNGVPDECEATRFIGALQAANWMNHRRFGEGVAASSDTAVITHYNQYSSSSNWSDNRGGAVVFEWNGGSWNETVTLIPPQVRRSDRYGASVAIDGNTIAVGAPNFDDDVATADGAVFVFEKTEGAWSLKQELTALPFTEWDIGFKVALHGDILIASSPYESNGPGTVYVYENQNDRWAVVAELKPSQMDSYSHFGLSLATNGTQIAVGAPHENGDETYGSGAGDVGSVYVFEKVADVWTETARIVPPGSKPDDEVGTSVALTTDRLFIGAINGTGRRVNSGRVIEYRLANGVWEMLGDIVPDDQNSHYDFGREIAVDGNNLVVGAVQPGPDCPSCRRIYIFDRASNPLQQIQMLNVHAQSTGDTTIALANDRLLVGAPTLEFGGNTNSGMVFPYLIDRGDCNLDGVLNDCELGIFDCNGNGRADACDLDGSDCNTNGIPDECDIANCPNGDPVCSDCNQNGVPDGCEVASLDCNANGVPDDCDIANCADGDSSCSDCNFDGVPDGCEIIEFDCNGNAISDECELPIVYRVLPPPDRPFLPSAIAWDSDILVLGDPGDDESAFDSGALYVYQQAGNYWNEIAKIKAPIVQNLLYLGGYSNALAIQDGTIIAGVLGYDGSEEYSGVVFVFERDGEQWNTSQTIDRPTQVPTGPEFGRAVAISGDRMLVSDLGAVDSLGYAGRVHSYQLVDGLWQYDATILPVAPRISGRFGERILFSGDTAVIVQYRGSNGRRSISVHRITESGWQVTAVNEDFQVNGVSPNPNDIEFDGQRLFMGDPNVSYSYPFYSSNAGAVDLFELENDLWQHVVRLRAPIPTSSEGFGARIGYDGQNLLIGRSGWALYHFKEIDGSWRSVNTATPGPHDVGSTSRWNILCQNGQAVASAFRVGFASGTTNVHVDAITLQPTTLHDCDGNGIPDECDPDAVDCDGNGVIDVCQTTGRECSGDFGIDRCKVAETPINWFITALMRGDPVDTVGYYCLIDLDQNGVLDGRDLPLFVDVLVNQ